jgi:predicted ATP-dependent endonuclease of OLD family
MPAKMLTSFEIRGFRAFDHLKLTDLGRVNLFVGKNNVGKSSLLEALWVYANQGSPNVLWSLLVDRNESESLSFLRIADRLTDEEVENQLLAFRYLFHGRKEKPESQIISLGSTENKKNTLTIEYLMSTGRRDNQQSIPFVDDTIEEEIPALSIKSGNNNPILIRLDRLFTRRNRDFLSPEIKSIFVPANGVSRLDVSRLWDSITLSPLEKDVLDSLRILDPRIERVTLVGSREGRERLPIVKISDFDQPLPLRSLGEGMNRIFGIALALVNAKGGMLLMDEVESGLHYSIQENVWDFIFQTAKRLDVQVFATTHSRDCFEAFANISNKSEEKGALIRLENKKGKISTVAFDEKELAIAARDQIEVR